ncbi:MAG: discoidin domain-containing protein [Terriglobales bacterium]
MEEKDKLKSASRRNFLGVAAATAASLAVPSEASAAMRRDVQAEGGPTQLTVRTGKVAAALDPDYTMATSVDILSHDDIQRLYTPGVIKICLSAGWGPISYRLHTPETVEYWHWNPRGTWSDPAKQQGYFVGGSEPTEMIRDSYGYQLAHRGCTHNGGTSGGYSRLNDGDPTTYWKSSPYLAQHFTGEDDSLHPQWIIVDLGEYYPVDAIRLDWAEPSARVYRVEYWVGDDPMNWEEPALDGNGEGGQYLPVSRQAMGKWVRFSNGTVTNGNGGRVTLKLADTPAYTRYVRVVMTQCNQRPAPGHDPNDIRSRLGYAIHEVYVGRLEVSGRFDDLVVHARDENRRVVRQAQRPNQAERRVPAPGPKQTATYCSSTDPWHTAEARNPRGDQTGLDLFLSSGITNNLPAMIPIAIIYGIPEDGAAQVAYMNKRGYKVGWLEMGEEADGQYYMPEDYAALYCQFANAIRKVDPTLKLGGPVYQGINQDVTLWPDAQGRTSWSGRFVDYLKAHGHLQDLGFFSFEIYPYASRTMGWKDLYRVQEINRSLLQGLRNAGVPKNVPLVNSESNLCGSLSRWMSDIFSALWLADNLGSFFQEGGGFYVHSPGDPGGTEHGGQGWGNWANFSWGPNNTVVNYMPFYWGSRLINLEWVKHGIGTHKLYRVDSSLEDAAGNVLVTAYAVERPDGEWALLVINKDHDQPHEIAIQFQGANGPRYFHGPVRMVTYGSEQYVWHGETANAYADPQKPPLHSTVAAGRGAAVRLPKASVTVLRGRLA